MIVVHWYAFLKKKMQMSSRYSKSINALLLKWCLQRGVACIIDSNISSLNEDMKSLASWDLHPKDKALIDALGK